jgi:hypothetical protein
MSTFAALKSNRQDRQRPLTASKVTQPVETTRENVEAPAESSASAPEFVQVDVDYGLPNTLVVKSSAARGRGVFVGVKPLKKGEALLAITDRRLDHPERGAIHPGPFDGSLELVLFAVLPLASRALLGVLNPPEKASSVHRLWCCSLLLGSKCSLG